MEGTEWYDQRIPREKLHFFEATVESLLLYGCESWTLKAAVRMLHQNAAHGAKHRPERAHQQRGSVQRKAKVER